MLLSNIKLFYVTCDLLDLWKEKRESVKREREFTISSECSAFCFMFRIRPNSSCIAC